MNDETLIWGSTSTEDEWDGSTIAPNCRSTNLTLHGVTVRARRNILLSAGLIVEQN